MMEKVLPAREAVLAEVRREFPGIFAMPGVIDPIDGALWRARLASAG
jgi:glucosamine kinase